MKGISDLTAAQLAKAGYPAYIAPSGWREVTSRDGTSRGTTVSLLVNDTTHQAVLSFKGTDSATMLYSDIRDAAHSLWNDIKVPAQLLFESALQQFPGYQFMADGHSAGGGMAKSFALANNIDAYAINALPIAPLTVQDDYTSQGKNFDSAVSAFIQAGHTSREINVSGDLPSTFLPNAKDLKTSTLTLASPFAACEEVGALAIAIDPPVGAAVVAACAYKAHQIDTAIDLLQQPATNTGDNAKLDGQLRSDAPILLNQVVPVKLHQDTNGYVTAVATDGSLVDVKETAGTANTAAYSISDTGHTNQVLDVVTDVGDPTINMNGGMAAVLRGDQATFTGTALDVGAGAGAALSIGGNGMNAGIADTVYGSGIQVSLTSNTRANIVGSHDSVVANTSDNFGVYGDADTLSAKPGDGVWVGTNGQLSPNLDTINASGINVSVSNGSRVQVLGDNDLVTAAGNDNLGVSGHANTVNGGVNANNNLWVGGDGQYSTTIDTVNESGGTVNVASNSRVDIAGSNDYVTAGTQDNFGVRGNNDSVHAQAGDGLWIGGDGQFAPVSDRAYVSGATVNIESNARVDVSGSFDTVNTGTQDNFGVYGGGDVIYSQPGDGIWIGRTSASDAVNSVSDSGATLNVANNSQVNLSGSYDHVQLGSGDTLGAGGGGNTINAGSDDHLWLTGTNGNPDQVNAAGLRGGAADDGQGTGVWLDNSTQATINGGGDSISAQPSDTVLITNTGTTPDQISGSSDSISYDANSSAYLNGSYDLTHGGNDNTLSIDGTNDPVYDNYSTIDYYGGTSADGDVVTGVGDMIYYGNEPLQTTAQPLGGHVQAIVVNINGDQVRVTPPGASTASFDADNSGRATRSAWITAGEGLLTLGEGAQGAIKGADLVHGYTGLTMLDANHDGVIDQRDPAWQQLRLWTPSGNSTQPAKSDLHTLAQLGISAIPLTMKNVKLASGDSTILYDGRYLSNGGGGDIAAVDLAYDRPGAGTAPAQPAQLAQTVADRNLLVQAMTAEPTAPMGIVPAPLGRAANDESPLLAEAHTGHQLRYNYL